MPTLSGMKRKSLQNRLGEVIREQRSALGYSQESYADAIGLHRNYVGGIERGERNVSLQNLEKLAKGLGLNLSELVAIAERGG